MGRIILKNSNGVDKEPQLADLELGEIAVNTVAGTIYTKMATTSGDLVGSTEFQNVYNVTPQPVFTVPTSAVEGQIVDVNITNYNASNIYGVSITGGSLDTSSNPFKWTLPAVTQTTSYGISISAQEPGKLESKPTPYQWCSVSNVVGTADDSIILNSTNIDTTTVPTLTNASIVNGTIIADADNITAETQEFEQEATDNDWATYKQSVQVLHNDIISDHSQELSSLAEIKVAADTPISTNDIVYTKQEGVIKTVQVGNVSEPEILFPAEEIAAGDDHSLILVDGKIKKNGVFNYNVESISDVKSITCTNYSQTALCIKKDGSVWGIGKNRQGQLGLGDTDERIDWTYLGFSAKKISGGRDFFVVIKEDDTVWSCGRNYYSQLGLGDSTDRNVFTDTGLTAKDVSCGYEHTIIIDMNDNILACGNNDSGRLGVGDSNGRTTFTSTGVTGKKVVAGYSMSILIKLDGTLWATGYNYYGELGLGDTDSRNSFTDIGLENVEDIGLSSYSSYCIINSIIYSCGRNNYGQLGLGDTTDRNVFTDTSVVSQKLASVNNAMYIMSINSNGEVYGAGRNNYDQLGIGDTNNRSSFTKAVMSEHQAKTLSNFTPSLTDGIDFVEYSIPQRTDSIAVGDHSLRIDDNGKLWARGHNNYGQLGLNDTTDRTDWTDTGITDVKSVAIGGSHSVILKNDGSVWVCGDNYSGQLGTGNTTDSYVFIDTGLTGKKIAVGGNNSFIIKDDNSLWGCGENSYGQLGIGSTSDVLSFVKLKENVVEVNASYDHTVIILEDGYVYTTGSNADGKLGLGDTSARNVFTRTNKKAKKIASGSRQTLIIDQNDEVWSCGDNAYGQLGLGDNDDRYTFTPVPGPLYASDIQCGDSFSFIIEKDTNKVYSCGYNAYGQLGLGDTTDRNVFTDTGEIASYIAFLGSTQNSVAIQYADNTYKVCGSNAYYQLNNTSTSSISSFVDPDSTTYTNQTPISNELVTQPSYFQFPEWMYVQSLKSYVSLEASSGAPNYIESTIEGTPVEIAGGLKYSYNIVTPASSGRYLQMKVEGLKEDEKVIEIRADLETT